MLHLRQWGSMNMENLWQEVKRTAKREEGKQGLTQTRVNNHE